MAASRDKIAELSNKDLIKQIAIRMQEKRNRDISRDNMVTISLASTDIEAKLSGLFNAMSKHFPETINDFLGDKSDDYYRKDVEESTKKITDKSDEISETMNLMAAFFGRGNKSSFEKSEEAEVTYKLARKLILNIYEQFKKNIYCPDRLDGENVSIARKQEINEKIKSVINFPHFVLFNLLNELKYENNTFKYYMISMIAMDLFEINEEIIHLFNNGALPEPKQINAQPNKWIQALAQGEIHRSRSFIGANTSVPLIKYVPGQDQLDTYKPEAAIKKYFSEHKVPKEVIDNLKVMVTNIGADMFYVLGANYNSSIKNEEILKILIKVAGGLDYESALKEVDEDKFKVEKESKKASEVDPKIQIYVDKLKNGEILEREYDEPEVILEKVSHGRFITPQPYEDALKEFFKSRNVPEKIIEFLRVGFRFDGHGTRVSLSCLDNNISSDEQKNILLALKEVANGNPYVVKQKGIENNALKEAEVKREEEQLNPEVKMYVDKLASAKVVDNGVDLAEIILDKPNSFTSSVPYQENLTTFFKLKGIPEETINKVLVGFGMDGRGMRVFLFLRDSNKSIEEQKNILSSFIDVANGKPYQVKKVENHQKVSEEAEVKKRDEIIIEDKNSDQILRGFQEGEIVNEEGAESIHVKDNANQILSNFDHDIDKLTASLQAAIKGKIRETEDLEVDDNIINAIPSLRVRVLDDEDVDNITLDIYFAEKVDVTLLQVQSLINTISLSMKLDNVPELEEQNLHSDSEEMPPLEEGEVVLDDEDMEVYNVENDFSQNNQNQERELEVKREAEIQYQEQTFEEASAELLTLIASGKASQKEICLASCTQKEIPRCLVENNPNERLNKILNNYFDQGACNIQLKYHQGEMKWMLTVSDGHELANVQKSAEQQLQQMLCRPSFGK